MSEHIYHNSREGLSKKDNTKKNRKADGVVGEAHQDSKFFLSSGSPPIS